jgi:hypothetical protein
MGNLRKPYPVKLIVGFISSDEAFFLQAEKLLIRKFGKIDFNSRILQFNQTDYYEPEFGVNLLRKFVSFNKLIDPGKISAIKVFTGGLEARLSTGNKKRRINIDPGYIHGAKLVLATTKDYAHRIYLSKGIYSEITLSFQNHQFQALPWTYPDYRTPEYLEIFAHIRQLFMSQIKK